jgi:5-deoxy-glucuronate isomerase
MRLHRPNGTLAREGDPVRLSAADAGWDYCGLHVVSLAAGEARSIDLEGVEAAVVPLSGSCRVETRDDTFDLAGRASPFTGIPDVAYIAAGSSLALTSPEGGRFAVATAKAERSAPSLRVPAGEVSVEVRGAGQASRQINGLLSAEVPGPQRLIVVEVLTPEGNWSSYPPHKHDEWGEGEVPLEEIYYFEISKPEGFGFHRTYTKDGEIDESVTVVSGDVFLIPRGYHGPCVAAPGYDMYYLNVMAGPDEERRWLINTDPDHAWVWESWEGMPQDPRLPMTSAEKRDQRRRS